MNLLPLVAGLFSPVALVIAVVIIILGLLILRFFIKTAFTLVKIAIIVLIAAAVYFGVQRLL